jgi:predicted ATPase/DNA-binding winged helix-turn-helix (wHTH) protein
MDNRDSSAMRGTISIGPFRLSAAERLLEKGGEPVQLGSRALDLLIALVEQAGKVVSQRELISRIWPDVTVEDANLRVHLAALRKALGDGHEGTRYIVNVPGRGYSLVAPTIRSVKQHPSPSDESPASRRFQRLPARLAHLIGRDDIVRLLSAQLMIYRFVSIVGPGGIGKTTVAISVAHELLDGFNGAVVFVDLAALTDAHLVPATVVSALGLVVQTQDPLLSLLNFIGDKNLLLVLDNCEHVIEVVAALAERVVRETSQAHVLTTSREALRAEGEHVYLLHALDCPPEDAKLTAAEALKYPAAQLFMERAAASGYGSELTDADAPRVAKICQRLDGIALAVELAASRAAFHGIRGTEELLDNRFKLLWQGRRTSLPRHQTLNAMLDWSYHLLSERERAVLSRLSVFLGDFTLQAAYSVASESGADDAKVIDAIESLIAKSLISLRVIDGSTYYRLLDTTQVYAAEKLANSGEADRIARRHAISYSNFLERDEVIQSTLGEHNLSAYAPHIGNVRAALAWALGDRGDPEVGIDLATSAAPLFIGLSLLEECRHWCERALAALSDTKRGTKQEMILLEALEISSMSSKGHGDRVRAALERALALAEAFEDRERQLRLLADLNLYLIRLGDFPAAMAIMERAIAISQVTKDPAGMVTPEWMAGVGRHLLGDQVAAQAHFERVMALQVELGTLGVSFLGGVQRVGCLSGLSCVLWLRGLSQRARSMTQSAINAAASQEYAVSTCVSLFFAATIDLWTGELTRAHDLIEQMIACAAKHLLSQYHADGIALRGELAIALNNTEVGIESLRDALAIMRAEQYNLNVTRFIGVLAVGLHKTGDFEKALLTIDGAVALANNSGARFYLAELLHVKARILASMPRPDPTEAMDCLEESLAVAREQGALAFELRSACTLASWLSEGGQRDQARRALSPVYERFTEGLDTVDLTVARRLVEGLA